MQKTKVWVLFAVVIFMIAVLAGCEDTSTSTQSKEAAISEDRQQKLLSVQPPPQIDYSLERQNLAERVTRFNDPNKLSYIYLLSDTGQVYTFLPIKGKVSSVNSLLTTPQQIVCKGYASGSLSCVAVESPQEDGSYGSNGDAIFFFTAENVYVEWNGKYLLVDQPLQLTSQPLMIYNAESK